MKTQICWPSFQFTGCHYALLSNSDSSLKRVTNELFFPSLFFDTDMRWGLYSYVLNQGCGRQRWSGEWGLLFTGVTAIHVKKMKAQIHKTKSCKSTDSAQMLHIIRSSTKNILCQFSQHLLLFPDQITDTCLSEQLGAVYGRSWMNQIGSVRCHSMSEVKRWPLQWCLRGNNRKQGEVDCSTCVQVWHGQVWN